MRFLLYADILGTREVYQKATDDSSRTAIVRRRELLEQALEFVFFSRMAAYDVALYIFSDTVLVTCPQIAPLLDGATSLFAHMLEHSLGATQVTDLTLLRGAIAYGHRLEPSGLTPSRNVQTITCIDTSLAVAYSLEGIRKGSRLYLDKTVAIDMLVQDQQVFLHDWISTPGPGHPVSSLREYLWPAANFSQDAIGFSSTLSNCHSLWRRLLLDRLMWDVPSYNRILLPLDETLKLLIRCSPTFAHKSGFRKQLLALLPPYTEPTPYPEFEWGVWFLALSVLARFANNSRHKTSLRQSLLECKKFLENTPGNYWKTFLTEAKKPDYETFHVTIKKYIS